MIPKLLLLSSKQLSAKSSEQSWLRRQHLPLSPPLHLILDRAGCDPPVQTFSPSSLAFFSSLPDDRLRTRVVLALLSSLPPAHLLVRAEKMANVPFALPDIAPPQQHQQHPPFSRRGRRRPHRSSTSSTNPPPRCGRRRPQRSSNRWWRRWRG